jgi:hypothetical protein
MQTQTALAIAIRRYLFKTLAQNCALARFQLLNWGKFTGRDIFWEILNHRRVFTKVVLDRGSFFLISSMRSTDAAWLW